MTVEQVSALIGASVTVLGLFGGVIGYLIKVERTLARIDTSLLAFCTESTKDRTQLWKTLTESKDDHQELAHKVGVLEARLALMPQHPTRHKPT